MKFDKFSEWYYETLLGMLCDLVHNPPLHSAFLYASAAHLINYK